MSDTHLPPLPDEPFGEPGPAGPGPRAGAGSRPASNGGPARGYDRVPPHSMEAEVSVLGAAMLSRTAANEAAEVLQAEDFYRGAHATVFESIAALLELGEPIDTVTLTDWLARRDRLDEVGGPAALHDLTVATPTAANAAYYAQIVRQKSLLRRLIDAGTAVARLGYEAVDDAEVVVDRAESLIYEVAQGGAVSQYSQLRDLLNDSFAAIEALAEQGSEVTGLATGFDDLDRLTSGLQPQNLIILAARPAMGKCLRGGARVLESSGRITTIAELVEAADPSTEVLALDPRGRLVPARVSEFHDNGVLPTSVLRTRSGRSIQTTRNHPFLTFGGWKELEDLRPGDRVAVPREIPVGGSHERADAEVALLAYLLGDGCLRGEQAELTTASPVIEAEAIAVAAASGADVRITRSAASAVTVSAASDAKALRFVRGHDRVRPADVAERAGVNWLRTWLEDLGLWGRGSHDTFIPDPVYLLPRRQLALFLSRLFATDGSAWVSEQDGDFGVSYTSVSESLIRGVQHLLLRLGVLSQIRERQVSHLQATDLAYELEIGDADNVRRFCREIGIFSKEEQVARALEFADRDVVHTRFRRVAELAEAVESDRLRDSAASDILWDEIVSIEPAGEERVYDLTVPGLHNFVADDLIVHNSSMVLNLAQYVSVELKKPAILFSLEMSKLEIVNRMLSGEARIESTKLRTGKLDDLDWRKLGDALGRLSDAPLFIDDTPSITLMEIRAKCRRLKAREGLDLVIVDYLQLMSSHGRVDSRQQEVAEFSRGLKMLAKELDVPVIALSQLSRQPESRTDKRPMMSDLRESGSLEQDADIVAFIYRDEVYDEDSPDRGIAELIVSKHRNGATGVVKLAFLNHLTKFANLARGPSAGGGGGGSPV